MTVETDNPPIEAASDADSVRLSCAQVRGGNTAVSESVDLPGARAVVFSRPAASGRGGDVHYVSVCGSGLISRFCVADVVGHGQTVAAVSDELHRVLRRLMNWLDHRFVLRRLNRVLERKGLDAVTTAAIATYFPPSRTLSFSYAGHPPGWWYSSAEHRWRRLAMPSADDPDTKSFVNGALAVIRDASFTRSRQKVEPGDRFLLVTDGILETRDGEGQLFGSERVEAVLDRHRRDTVEDLSHSILDELERFSVDSGLAHDDVTFLLVEFTRPPGMFRQMMRNRLRRILNLFRRETGPAHALREA
ncbi:MAG: PP2C family protein-serine/threonine phosphatase [Planctomycetota bacterium]|nr:PP2C family protein-serine/threonine phosphatase [Planctomycetota bacterium]